MVLKQTVIISSASTVVLVLLTSTIVYFYSSYARPEAVHPKKLKADFEKREKSVSAAVDSIKARFPDNLKFSEQIDKTADKFTKNVPADLEPQKPLKDHEIKILFKNIATTDNKKARKARDIEQINPIKFPPLKMPEPPVVEVPKSFRPSEEVYIGQVGLSLYTGTYFAAVYRIQNLFGKAGLVGHYFVINPNLDWDTFEKFKVAQINFSTRERFKEYFKGQKVEEITLPPKTQSTLILINSDIVDTKTFNEVLEPEVQGEQIFYINSYKWLHLATLLNGKLPASSPAIHALIFPQDEAVNQDGIVYPKDVRVFELDWMKTADVSLHSGCIKRIQNHCRDYFAAGEVDL